MAEIEKTAAANAERNGTGAGTEKQKLVDGILKDAEPVVNRMKELAGKMNSMVERIGNPQILWTNTFYQQYKMEYDFCARKLIDSGIAWGDGQVVKEYISKNSLFQDKMELRRTNYMQSYRDRIVTGGSEQFETDSYLKDTTYDYGKWAKVGDLLAKTIYRPFFSKVEREVEREPKEDRFEKKEGDPQGKEGAKMPVDQPESVDKYAKDIFGNESIDYDTILQAAADSISEKLSNAPDADRDYYQQASADIAYEISDLDGKPMDNLETIVSAMQDNGISEEDTDTLWDQTGDRYEDPGFDPSFDDVEEDLDYVDFPEEDMDLSETEDFLDDLEERADMAQDAIYEAQQDGVDLPEDTLSSVMAEDDLPDDISDLLESLKNQMIENGVTEEDRDAIDKGLYQPEDLDYSQIDFSNDYDN